MNPIKTDPYDAAFARPFSADNGAKMDKLATYGLTKREYFAALAMQNLQNVLLRESGRKIIDMRRNSRGDLGLHAFDLIALEAVDQADALIKALNLKESK